MLRPVQKIVALINHLVWKFSKPGDLVLDKFAGILSKAKVCLLLDKNGRFVGYENDSGGQ